MIKSPWAVLLCKFSDDSTEPFTRDYYEDLFTASGVGSQNMVDYFRDVSHGNLDLSDTRVFGWFTLDKTASEYGLTGAEKLQNRRNLINWARQAVAASGYDFSPYVERPVVVCMNVPTDLFGGGVGAVCDNNSTDPRYLGQEMGHFYGLDHSRADGSTEDYKDRWDVMSTAAAFSATHPRYGPIGPGLNAANMASRGWLDKSRVWETSASNVDTVVSLRPLHRYDLPGFLAIQFGGYFVEFRNTEGWDGGIPKPTVLVHTFRDQHSYIISDNNGQQEFDTGSVLANAIEIPDVVSTASSIEVLEINADQQFAKIRLYHQGTRVNYIVPEDRPFRNPGVAWGVIADGNILGISPRSPLLKALEHVALYESSEAISSVQLRNAVRLEALSAIVDLAQDQMQTLQDFGQPPPPQETQEYEGE